MVAITKREGDEHVLFVAVHRHRLGFGQNVVQAREQPERVVGAANQGMGRERFHPRRVTSGQPLGPPSEACHGGGAPPSAFQPTSQGPMLEAMTQPPPAMA